MRCIPRGLEVGLLALVPLVACQSSDSLLGLDEAAWMEAAPRSILVLPPLDETLEMEAGPACAAAITAPLARAGYYVFPIGLVSEIMHENGLPTPFEMHQVTLARLVEVFDPDVVLYLTVHEYGSSYQVVHASTQVEVSGRAVQADTGQILWEGVGRAYESSGGGGSLTEVLITALSHQIDSDSGEDARRLAKEASHDLFEGRGKLPPGPYARQR